MTAFCRLYADGLIYRSKRLVNWCPRLQSTIADVEVDQLELDQPGEIEFPSGNIELGYLYFFDYPLEENLGKVCVATTRPETILADVAIAVNPADARYSHLIGKFAKHPFIEGRRLPIVPDSAVDPEFGTGAVKITPAHSFADFEIGQRHQLPLNVECFDDRVHILPSLPFAGLSRFEARRKIVDALANFGLFHEKRVRPGIISYPICSRSGELVEPRLKEQWFLAVGDIAKDLIFRIDSQQIEMYPEFWLKDWRHWLANSKDWCLSRQLWWGHRIPAYKCAENKWVVVESEDPNSLPPGAEQDPDVLDTWFSSALIPLACAGWPEKLDSDFYPLTLMETGHDILKFWVNSMALLGLKLTAGRFPFKKILLHGLIRDAHGRKMSKSLGNVIDPRAVISGESQAEILAKFADGFFSAAEKSKAQEGIRRDFPNGIPECGADALRFSLLSQNFRQRDINFNVAQCFHYRTFCNKIWQAFGFMSSVWAEFPPNLDQIENSTTENSNPMDPMDRWIFSRLGSTVLRVTESLPAFEFNATTGALHHFWWSNLCDWYIEATKPAVWSKDRRSLPRISANFWRISESFFRLLAPLMPFLSAELYRRIPGCEKFDVHARKFPKIDEFRQFFDLNFESQAKSAEILVNALRSVRKDFDVSIKIPMNAEIFGLDSPEILENFRIVFDRLTNFRLNFEIQPKNSGIFLPVDSKIRLKIELPDGFDLAKLVDRFERQISKKQKNLAFLERQQKSPKYSLPEEEFLAEKSALIVELERLNQLLSSVVCSR